MAGNGGNLGNLFFTLGIKVGDVEGFDKFMKELDKPKEELSALEKYAKKHLDSLSKANQQYIKELNRIEKAQGKLDFKEYLASLTREKSGLAETTQWLKQKAVALNAVAAAQSRANRRDVFMTAVNNLTAPKAVDNADYWRRQERLAAAANTELGKQGRLLTQLKTAAGSYVSIWTASQFIQSLVRITGEFELQRVSLRAMLNDINAADKIFSQTKALAVQSPFQFMDLMGFSKQLAAFSVPVSELFETTKMLSDISAGLGVDMGRIVLAYSQIRSAAVLRSSEVRQLTEAGVPILEDLAKMFTQMEGQAVTIGEVFERISTRQVPFKMVEQAFKNMTSEGGKFYRMQEVQAETLRGQVTNLIDAWQIAMYELGSSSEGFLKGAVGAIRSLIENFHLVVDAIMAAVAAFGAYNAAALVMAARNGTVAASFARLSKSMKQLGAFLGKNPWAAAIAALAALGTVIWRVVRRSNELKDSLEETAAVNFNKAEESVYGFNKLIKQLTEAEKGSKNYSDAVSALNAKYGEYLPHLLSEADALDVVTSKYESITQAIYAKAQAQAYEAQMNKISEEYDGDILEAQSELVDRLVEAGMLKPEAYDAVKLFNTRLNERYPDGINGVSSSEIQELITGILKEYLGDRYSSWDYRFLNTAGALLQDARNPLMKYVNLQQGRRDMEEMAASITDAAWGDKTDYNTAEERRRAGEIEKIYQDTLADINNANISYSEREAEMREAQIARLRSLIDLYAELGDTSKQNSYANELDRMLNTDTSGWIKKASEIKDVFAQLYFRPDYEGPFEHFDRWKQDYDDAVEKLSKVGTGNLSDSAVSALENQRDMLNRLSVMLGFGEGFENYRTIKERQKAADKEAKERLDMIRDWIKRIKDARDLYEEFRDLHVPDGQMAYLFNSLFGEFGRHGMDSGAIDAMRNMDFSNAIKVYQDILRQGTPEMQVYADEVDEDEWQRRIDKNNDKIRKLIKSRNELMQILLDASTVFQTQDFTAIREIEKKYAEQQKKLVDMLTDGSINKDIYDQALLRLMMAQAKETSDWWIDNYGSYSDRRLKLVNEWERRIAEAPVQYQEQMRGQMKDELFKLEREYTDVYRRIFGNVSNMSRKSIRQAIELAEKELSHTDRETSPESYKALMDALNGLRDADMSFFSDHWISGFDNVAVKLNEILTLRNRINESEKKGVEVSEDDLELLKHKKEELGYMLAATGVDVFVSGLQQAAEYMSQFADISGDIELSNTAEQLGAVAQNLSAAAQGAATGGWIGAIVGGVTDLLSQAINGFAQMKLYSAQVKADSKEFARQVKLNEVGINEDDYEGVFGDASMKKAQDAYRKAQENLAEYNRLVKERMEDPGREYRLVSLWEGLANPSSTETNLSKTLNDAYERGLSALQGMAIKTKDYNGFYEFFGAQDEYTALADLAPDIFNEDGSLNIENAKDFLETNHQLTDEQRKQLEYVIETKEQYDELMGIVDEYLSSLLGSVADDISNAIFDAVLNGADAWDVFNDSAVSVIDNIGRQMIQEFVVGAYLSRFEDELKSAFDSDDPSKEIAETMFDIYGGLGEVLGAGMDAYQQWLDMMQANGLDISQLYGQGESLSKDIQSITENQADLLASYVNAIRAYVAQIVEQGIKNGELLSNINETINEAFIILKEINSNTAAINGNTAQIERLMRSLTTSGSAVAINARMM